MINTSQGAKTPAEALAIFTAARLPKGALLGIFNQLADRLPEGKKAHEFVLEHPELYSDKIVRLAQEQKTGRPVGTKAIKSADDLYEMLRACEQRAEIEVIVRREQAIGLRRLLNLSNLTIDDRDKGGLLAVAYSGKWGDVSRTFKATLFMTVQDLFAKRTQAAMMGVIDSIKLIDVLEKWPTTPHNPQPLSDEVTAILAANPGLSYDHSLFREVCVERNFSGQLERVDELPYDATMQQALMVFRNNGSREEFLEFYIAHYEAFVSS